MYKIKKTLFYFIVFLSVGQLSAQNVVSSSNSFSNTGEINFEETEIPFERYGNYIILKISLEGYLPLRFLYDTGAEHTILSQKEIAKLLNLKFERSIDILGTDLHTPIKAYIARRVTMEMPGLRVRKDILVLDQDIFEFDKFLGLNINGILGVETFKNFIVKIDYRRQVLTVTAREAFNRRSLRGFDSFDIEVSRNKPYVKVNLEVTKDSSAVLNLLIDTGAGIPLLLYAHSTPGLSMPPRTLQSTLGSGLGGNISGYLGRVERVQFGNVTINNALGYFQELENMDDTIKIYGRSGILGNDILARFIVVLDLTKQKLYLKKEKAFYQKFVYDRSGISLFAADKNLDRFFVNEVLHHSPAEELGIERGDEITRIGWLPAHFFSLSTINKMLQGAPGKIVSVTVKRGIRILKFKIKLRDLI